MVLCAEVLNQITISLQYIYCQTEEAQQVNLNLNLVLRSFFPSLHSPLPPPPPLVEQHQEERHWVQG